MLLLTRLPSVSAGLLLSGTNPSTPRIQWDGTGWLVRLPVQDGSVLEAKWSPGSIYVVRIRQAGTEA